MPDAPTPSTSPTGATPKPPLRRILAAFLLPLFFIVFFPLAFTSAIHAVGPNDLAIRIVGPDQVVSKIADGIDRTSAFSVQRSDRPADARAGVEHREVAGAISIQASTPTGAEAAAAPTFTVRTYVASGGGAAAASAVEALGERVADKLGTTTKTVDVAPLGTGDPQGTALFYFLVYTSLAGYLIIIVLMQVAPGTRLRSRFGVVAASAIVSPLLAFGLASIFVGDYGASFGTIAALLGVDAVYIFTVGNIAILANQFLGNAATFGIMATVVMLNFPSAGGIAPSGMLPGFWQIVHDGYFGSGAFESFRSLIYFSGNGLGRWFPQLIAWAVGLVLVNLVVRLTVQTRQQRAEIRSLRPTITEHRHLVAERHRVEGRPSTVAAPKEIFR